MHYNHIVMCVMYYNLINSSLLYILCTCYVSLYDYICIAHTHVHVQTRKVYSVWQVVFE